MIETRKYRRRVSLACTNCKRRKLKCDHKVPCTACRNTKMFLPECTYQIMPPNSSLKQQQPQGDPASAPTNPVPTQVSQMRTYASQELTPPTQTTTRTLSSHVDGNLEASQRASVQTNQVLATTNSNLVSETPHSTTASTSTKATKIDLQDFIFMKEFNGSRVFFGPTCWKTSIMYWCRSFPVLSDILAITIKEMATLKLPDKPDAANEGSPNYHITSLLPNYRDAQALLNSFERDTFFTKCFNRARYIVLSIKALVSFFDGEVPDPRLLVASRLFLLKTDLKSNFATLSGLLLLYECRKYDCNIDFEEALSYDQGLFSTIITVGLSLGLHRNILTLHSGDPTMIASLQHMWKFLMFEDSLRSFQRGSQPMINDNYTSNQLLRLMNTKCTIAVLAFRKVNDAINLCVSTDGVDLDAALSLIEELFFDTPPTDHDDLHLQMFIFSYAQTISTIRYLKCRNHKNRFVAFQYSLMLYLSLKEMLMNLVDSSGRIKPSCFYQEIKESIFRATFFMLVLILQLYERVEKIAGTDVSGCVEHEGRRIHRRVLVDAYRDERGPGDDPEDDERESYCEDNDYLY
ncbi:hypothetical protein Cantr_06850 [Candida viswanathii]|uniref:Zn(2)-C6 fungal-type domain-containing protein n=1 Tax=Candida viswanathii TaxID=5486 RepID=A0A367XUN0_9ASCO|nr:hypothetical protein Cantr_06850 [Candida viswanathii]